MRNSTFVKDIRPDISRDIGSTPWVLFLVMAFLLRCRLSRASRTSTFRKTSTSHHAGARRSDEEDIAPALWYSAHFLMSW